MHGLDRKGRNGYNRHKRILLKQEDSMKEQVARRSKKNLFLRVLIAWMLLMIVAVSPQAIRADSGDSQLRAMESDIKACMQSGVAGQAARIAFSQKYNVPLSKVNEIVSGHSQSNDATMAEVLCLLEKITLIGLQVWSDRAKQDVWFFSGGCKSGADYCTTYSLHCSHYNWDKDCLSLTAKRQTIQCKY